MCITIRLLGIITSRLQKAIELLKNRSDMLIFTGGLGPTKDDLTKETIASHLDEKLCHDEQGIASIEGLF